MSDDHFNEKPSKIKKITKIAGLAMVMIGGFGLAIAMSGGFDTDEDRAEKCGNWFTAWGETIEWADGESVNPLTESQLEGFHAFISHPDCVKITDMDAMYEGNPKLMSEYDVWKKRNGIEGIIVR